VQAQEPADTQPMQIVRVCAGGGGCAQPMRLLGHNGEGDHLQLGLLPQLMR
jgi:hypothetical protein